MWIRLPPFDRREMSVNSRVFGAQDTLGKLPVSLQFNPVFLSAPSEILSEILDMGHDANKSIL